MKRESVIEKSTATPVYAEITGFNEVNHPLTEQNIAYRKIGVQQQMLDSDGYVSFPIQGSGSVDPKICNIVNEDEPTYDSIQ